MLTKTACLWHRELKQELCNNLEGWGGEGDEREVQEGGGHMYTYGWFMLMFGRNQQKSVKQLSFNKKKIQKKNTLSICFNYERKGHWPEECPC